MKIVNNDAQMKCQILVILVKQAAIILSVFFTPYSHAHKEITHEEIAQKAYDLSVLNDEQSEIWRYLNIDPKDQVEMGTIEADNAESIRAVRHINLFPKVPTDFTMFRVNDIGNTPLVLIRSGAHFEDQLPRVCSHFFDPKNNRALD